MSKSIVSILLACICFWPAWLGLSPQAAQKSEAGSPKPEVKTTNHGPQPRDREHLLKSLEGQPNIRIFSDKDGLPQNSIQGIVFDKKGYLWVGTQDGVAFYNGQKWVSLNLPNQSLSNAVEAMIAASDGSIWFGTNGGGLAKYSDGGWTSYTTQNSGLANDRVRCLLETISPVGHHRLWVGTYAGGLSCFENNQWTNFTTANSGLPNNYVYSLLETLSDSGARRLWVGTMGGGLALVEEVRNPQSAVRSREAGGEKAKSGHGESGLTTDYDQRTTDSLGAQFSFHWTVLNTRNSGLTDDRVSCLELGASPSGVLTLWIGTQSGLVCMEDVRGPQSEPVGEKANRGTGEPDLTLDNGQRTTDTPLSNRWTTFTAANSKLPDNTVSCLKKTISPTGNPALWVGTMGGGLARLEDARSPQSAVLKKDSGQQTADNGQILNSQLSYQWVVFNTKNSELPNNLIVNLAETVSATGNRMLWVGTNGGGLVRLTGSGWLAFDTRNSGLQNNVVLSLLETVSDKGRPVLWFGTLDGGLARYEAGQWTNFDTKNSGLPNDRVFCLRETITDSGSRGLWIGTYGGGLARYEFQTNRWTTFSTKNSGLPNDTVFSLMETVSVTGNRCLWVGTAFGLGCYEAGRWSSFTTKNSGLPDSRVTAMLETVSPSGSRRLWFGTGEGLAYLEEVPSSNLQVPSQKSEILNSQFSILNSTKWMAYTTNNSGLPGNEVYGLQESVSPSGRHELWVGTLSGVGRLELNSELPRWWTLSSFTTPALSNHMVLQIREDSKKRMYLFTSKGVTRLTRRAPTLENPAEYELFTFSVRDGLPSSECSQGASLVDSQGRIWAGTAKGAAVYDPMRESDDHFQKPLVIERMLLEGKERNLREPISLGYNENNLFFEYALLNFYRESDTRYQVQLEGFNPKPSDWTTELRKEYTNLPEGNYVFKVWGRDYAGNRSGPVNLAFTIRPAPWRTWWAYLTYLATVTCLGFGGFRLRLQVLERHNRLLEDKITERTAQLAEKNEELDKKNEELAKNVNLLEVSKLETEKKNDELARKNEELVRSKAELVESNKQAERIFSALADVLPGTVLEGKYRLEEKIGSGGFGAVYRALHVVMKREVAVKIFRPSQGNSNREGLERFLLEAVSTSRINHPNAVTVMDSGVSMEGIAYLVMELLKGVTLADDMRLTGKFTPERCAEIVIPVCSVLAKAHAMGIIHRDIKPDNIFLHKAAGVEVVKVVDFGIAKIMGESANSGNLTMTGAFIGTPTYTAPERWDDLPYDGRSDVYSLGVVMYQMLCGKAPYQVKTGESLAALFTKILTQPPRSLRELNPKVPPAVDDLIIKTLQRYPNRRPTAKELAQSLAEALGIELEPSSFGTIEIDREEFSRSTDETQTGFQPGALPVSEQPTVGVGGSLSGDETTPRITELPTAVNDAPTVTVWTRKTGEQNDPEIQGPRFTDAETVIEIIKRE